MRILTLNATLRSLAASAFRDGTDEPVFQQCTTDQRDGYLFDLDDREVGALASICGGLRNADLLPPDVMAVRGLYGGERFTQPEFVSDRVLADLLELAPQAPLHIPGLIHLVQELRQAFPAIPILLVFETSFFVSLPEREQYYGIAPEPLDCLTPRRFGFHGIYHEAARFAAARKLGTSEGRMLSICLEPRPELAACYGRRPLMVTGGSTPAEGLVGEASCGDLDPSVVLKLAADGQAGPEAASRLLTSESGLRGIAGRTVSLAEVLDGGDDLQLARDVFLHSLLRACGAGIAALGGLDAIVYSGRYADSAAVLHDWLHQRLKKTLQRNVPSVIHRRSLPQHLRDIALVAIQQQRMSCSSER